jgi:hypothetical protein
MKNPLNVPNWPVGFLGLVCLGFVTCFGCNESATNQSSSTNAATETKLPKLNLHLPKTGVEAVARMKELVAGISAEGPLPEPIVYTVREVIHGTGASAHSHYHRENKNEEAPNFDHDGHEEMESAEKLHQVSVEPLEELRDLAYGLPDLAAKGKIDEKSWTIVKEVSKEITGLLGRHNDKTPLAKKREEIKSQAKQFEAWFEKIDDCLNAGSEEKSEEGQ